MQNSNDDILDNDNLDQDTKHLMDQFGLDSNIAERAKEIMDLEGVSEDEAIELAEDGN